MDMQRKDRLTAKRTDAIIDAAAFGLGQWEHRYAVLVLETSGKQFVDPETLAEMKELRTKIEFLRRTLNALKNRTLAIRGD